MKLYELLNANETGFIKNIEIAQQELQNPDDLRAVTAWKGEIEVLFRQFRLQIGYDILDKEVKDLTDKQMAWLREKLIELAVAVKAYCNQALIPNLTREGHAIPVDFLNVCQKHVNFYLSTLSIKKPFLPSTQPFSLPVDLSMSSLDNELFYWNMDLLVRSADILVRGADIVLRAGAEEAKAVVDVVVAVDTEVVKLAADVVVAIAHLAADAAKVVAQAAEGVGHIAMHAGHAVAACCHKDCCECFGSVAVVGGGGAVTAVSALHSSSATTVPPDVVHAVTNGGTAKAAMGGKTIGLGSGLGLAKLILGSLYAALLVPTLLKATIKDVSNLFNGYKLVRSASRLTAQTVGMAIGFVVGWFVPFGGPITAMTLAVLFGWAGQKLSKWYHQRQDRKKFQSVISQELLPKLDEDTQDRLEMTVARGCSNKEKYHLSSAELSILEERGINSSSAQFIMSKLETIARVEKVASKVEQNCGWGMLDRCYGFYKENEPRKQALAGIRYMRLGNTISLQEELEVLGIKTQLQLQGDRRMFTIQQDHYKPSESIAARGRTNTGRRA